jgi:hypothetical protein
MPGLLRGMARTAVVAGTATAVSNRVSRRQYNKWSDEDAANASNAEPAQQAAPVSDPYVELEKLGQLKADGIITDEEFAAKKQQILGL